MSENIGLIAGKGQFPLLFAQAARQQGAAVIAVAHRGETDPALASFVAELHWIHVGQLGKIIRIFKAAGVRRAVGIQARILNQMIEELFAGHPISETRLRELVGHTPFQVIMGAALGIGLVWVWM